MVPVILPLSYRGHQTDSQHWCDTCQAHFSGDVIIHRRTEQHKVDKRQRRQHIRRRFFIFLFSSLLTFFPSCHPDVQAVMSSVLSCVPAPLQDSQKVRGACQVHRAQAAGESLTRLCNDTRLSFVFPGKAAGGPGGGADHSGRHRLLRGRGRRGGGGSC